MLTNLSSLGRACCCVVVAEWFVVVEEQTVSWHVFDVVDSWLAVAVALGV